MLTLIKIINAFNLILFTFLYLDDILRKYLLIYDIKNLKNVTRLLVQEYQDSYKTQSWNKCYFVD